MKNIDNVFELYNNLKNNAIYLKLNDYYEKYDELWKGLTSKFYKLETLDFYNVDNDPGFEEFKNNNLKAIYMTFSKFKKYLVADNSLLKNKVVQKRLRLYSSNTLSVYEQFEAYSYLISEKQGQEIRVTFSKILLNLGDWILFDELHLFLLDFDSSKNLKGAYYIERNIKNEQYFIYLISLFNENFEKSCNFKEVINFDKNIINNMKDLLL